jgi:hypothetical protein
MKTSVLRGYTGTRPAQSPEGFAERLETAGRNMRGKVISHMTTDDWDQHRLVCAAALEDEERRVRQGPLTPQEQRCRVSVETAALTFRVVIRRLLQELGDPSMDLLSLLREGEQLELGGDHTLHRRQGSAGFALDNHQSKAGFPVDIAVEVGGRGLFLFDTTLSFESWMAAQDIDEQRFTAVRAIMEKARAAGTQLQKFDVLLDEGCRLRADALHKPVPGMRAFTVPLRQDAFAITEKTLDRMPGLRRAAVALEAEAQ